MKQEDVMIARIYLNEGERHLDILIKQLRDWEKLRGVTVFRGIAGYGDSGVIHGSGVIDFSLELPVVVEFFDTPDKVQAIVDHLNNTIKPGHIVMWSAKINQSESS